MVGTCIEKLYKGKRIVGYRIKFIDGSVQDIESKQLKYMKEQGLIHIDNLKFTQDGRLIDMKTPWPYSEKMENASEELGKARESLIKKVILVTDRVAVCNFQHARKSSLGDGYADAFYMKFEQLIDRQVDIMADFIQHNLRKNRYSIFKPNPYRNGANLSDGTLKCEVTISKEHNDILDLDYFRFRFNTKATFTSTQSGSGEEILNIDEVDKKINRSLVYTGKEYKAGELTESEFNNIIAWLNSIIIYKELVNYKLDLTNITDRYNYNKTLNKHIIETINSVENNKTSSIVARILQSANL